MNVEQRGHVKQPCPVSNYQTGGDAGVKAKPFVIEKRDVHRAGLLVKANQGAAGVDGRTIADFESNLKGNLYKLWNRLSSGSYYPPPVKGVTIPKKSSGERLLGIPTVVDRVIEHSRHRSIKGFMLTVLGGLIAYCLKWKKPSLKVFYSEDDFSVTI